MNYKELALIVAASALGGILTALIVEMWVKPMVQTKIDKKAKRKLAATQTEVAV